MIEEILTLLAADRDGSGPLPPVTDDRPSTGTASGALVRRLESHRPRQPRYTVVGAIDVGGQGEVLKVWDSDLRRHLAMKVALCEKSDGSSGLDERRLARFLNEAQITGQLEHPGIVPVHELGIDEDGRVFFTMQLVRGHTLAKILAERRTPEGRRRWSRAKVLGILERACEAVAFAHDRRVIHRDLKPANIMVGRFGETYVMDWGLGRLLDAAADSTTDLSGIHTFREHAEEAASTDVTKDGDVVGTVMYMPPEQARGDLAQLGKATDVYALGAILYELLSGQRPYEQPGVSSSQKEIWLKVLASPPAPIEELAPKATPELQAICSKAMARDPADRFRDVGELRNELSAFLEGRVVRAYRVGPIAELQKWVVRNKAVAAALLALIVVASSAGFVVSALESNRLEAVTTRDRGVDLDVAVELLDDAEALWPWNAEQARRGERWIAFARSMVAKLPMYRERLSAFERRHRDATKVPVEATTQPRLDKLEVRLREIRDRIAGLAVDPDYKEKDLPTPPQPAATQIAILEVEVRYLEQEIAVVKTQSARTPTARYGDPALDLEYSHLHALVADLSELAEPARGTIARIEQRMATWRQATEQHAAWTAATEEIAELYDGLRVEPQDDLVPLGRNARGLYEFWHAHSGVRPPQTADGFGVTEDSGIVLVLIPGGETWIGTQDQNSAGPNYCDTASDPLIDQLSVEEHPPHCVDLRPYLLSKYELTQGQWFRATRSSPSGHPAGNRMSFETRVTRSYPVEQVSWDDGERVLGAWGLTLPTEAQWEHAARAGSQQTYGPTATFAEIENAVNFMEQSIARAARRDVADQYPFDDGFPRTAPVDAYRGNAWGLHGMLDNVSEWCRDWFWNPCDPYDFVRGPTGEIVPAEYSKRAIRGGSWLDEPGNLRISRRRGMVPSAISADIGLRPSRDLNPRGAPQRTALERTGK